MTEKIIRIKNVSFEDTKMVIQQWIDLYSDDLSNDFQIVLHGNNRTHFIEVDKRIDNEHFYYLVNYLNYPENITYSAQIDGYIVGKEKELKDQELIIYISENETEYDNVFAVNNKNQHFKIDFGGKIKEVSDNKSFSTFQLEKTSSLIVLKASKKKVNKNANTSKETKINKRFKLFLLIVVCATVINLLVPFFTSDIKIFEKSTWFIFMGIGLWFFMDYEMLRLESFYIRCLMISLGVIGYCYLLTTQFQTNISELTMASSLYPLTFLLVQWPTRRVYKIIFKREPEVDKHGKFADLIYTLILFIGFALLPFLILDYLK